MTELEQIQAQLFALQVSVGALLDQVSEMVEAEREPPEQEKKRPRFLGDTEAQSPGA